MSTPPQPSSCMGFLRRAIPWLLLWGAFLAFGIFLRTNMPWDGIPELHGLDYGGHGIVFSDYRWIAVANFRHPLLGLFTAPLPLFGQRLLAHGAWPFWIFLLVVFAAIMTVAAYLLHSTLSKVVGMGRCGALAGTVLFVSFSYTWLLAACPESFPIACVAALLVLRWGMSNESSANGRIARIGWCALAIFNGGVTATNGIKVILAFFAVRGITRKRVYHVACLCAVALIIVMVAILGRYAINWLAHGAAKANLSDGWTNSFLSFCHGLDVKTRWSLIANFFSEPIITHGDPLAQNHLSRPYVFAAEHVVVVLLYVLAAAGGWLGRRHVLVRMILSMFLVDFLLHVVLFWGMDEGHIYCGHWLYAPAMLAAFLPSLLAGWLRRGVLALLFVLACAIFTFGAYQFATGGF